MLVVSAHCLLGLVRQALLFAPLYTQDEFAVCRGVTALTAVTFVFIAGATIQEIVAVMSNKGIVASQTLQNVVSAESQDGVVALPADQDIIAGAAEEDVAAVVSKQDGQYVILFCDQIGAQENVITLVAGEKITTRLTDQQVVGIAAPGESRCRTRR